MFRKFTIALLLTIIICGFNFNKLSAQEANGLSISPAIIIGPHFSNKQTSYSFKLISDTNKTVYVSLRQLYKTSNITKPELSDEVPAELLSWFTFEDQIIIKEGEEFEYILNIKTQPNYIGNYNFALIFTESNPTYDDNTNTTFAAPEIAIPVILNIIEEGGEFFESLNVERLNVDPTISFDGRNSFDIQLKNAGVSFLIPRGVLTVESVNTLVGTDEESIPINSDKQVLLRDSSYDFTFEKNFTDYSFGRYKATLAVVYGSNNDVITKEIYFWKFPQWFIVIVTVLIMAVSFLIFKRIYKLRKK